MKRKRRELIPIQFIDEEITTYFNKAPIFSKKPGHPDSFRWGDDQIKIIDLLSTWFDYQRKGRVSKNMREEHLRQAQRKGSWGVGRYYFRVRTEDDRIFDIYYDRAPKEAGDREGHWYLWRELEERNSG